MKMLGWLAGFCLWLTVRPDQQLFAGTWMVLSFLKTLFPTFLQSSRCSMIWPKGKTESKAVKSVRAGGTAPALCKRHYRLWQVEFVFQMLWDWQWGRWGESFCPTFPKECKWRLWFRRLHKWAHTWFYRNWPAVDLSRNLWWFHDRSKRSSVSWVGFTDWAFPWTFVPWERAITVWAFAGSRQWRREEFGWSHFRNSKARDYFGADTA